MFPPARALAPVDNSLPETGVTLTGDALVISDLTVRDGELVADLSEWVQNHPGGPDAAVAELPQHIGRLLSVGARVSEMGRHSVAAELVTTASRNARDHIGAAAGEVAGSVQRVREEMATLVGQFRDEVRQTLDAMLAGNDSAVAATLRETLRSQTEDLARGVTERIDATVSATLKTGLDGHVTRISETITEVRDHLLIGTAVEEASAALADRSNLKGIGFEDRVNELLEDLAAQMSAEYLRTGQTPGALKGEGSQLKGDGVWIRDGAAVVVECHNGMSRSSAAATRSDGWIGYLTTAMRNRGASAALGVVRTPEQNRGNVFREFGPNMAVLACDPGNPDDLIRLRFVMQVMGLVARHAMPATSGEPGVTNDDLAVDLSTARRALETMRSGMDAVTEIEKLAAKTSQNAAALHDKAQALKLSLIAPLDRAREAIESQTQRLGLTTAVVAVEETEDEEVETGINGSPRLKPGDFKLRLRSQ